MDGEHKRIKVEDETTEYEDDKENYGVRNTMQEDNNVTILGVADTTISVSIMIYIQILLLY